ncbi:EamA family transporter [Candidatus Dojkabacteria bacterium]|nr:EamA family transporter [Candidatus Dojkabacteria bacterium]
MGLLYAFLASTFTTARNVLNKKIAINVESVISTFATFLYSLPFYAFIILIQYFFNGQHFEISKTLLIIVFLRNGTDILNEYFKLKAYETGELSLVSGILTLSPIFTLILSNIFIGEKVTYFTIVGILLVIIGNILLSESSLQSKTQKSLRSIVYALISSFLLGVNLIFDKLVLREASPLIASFLLALVASGILFPIFLLQKRQKRVKLMKYKRSFLFRGACECIYMLSKITALKYLSAPVVDSIKKSSVLNSIIFGKIIFKEKNFKKKILGGIFMFGGLLLIILYR